MSLLIESSWVILLHFLLFAALCYSKTSARWKIAEGLLSTHLMVAIGLLVFSLWQSEIEPDGSLFSISALSMTVMVLISFIGLIVLRFARQNLVGDPDDARFLRWYLCTLLAVGVAVSANNLVLFFLAWVTISLCLHKLLLFYPERPRAALAAHKKFIFARLSESLLFLAFIILYFQHNSVDIQFILSSYADSSSATILDHVAAVLLAMVALIKCAQLPLHGWLIQVVEAPTPVSALLHAGIINLGGFLLLLFSPLLSLSVFAQWLLLIVAGLSCVIAALIMMTRISIKVRLAWSTVTQMGLMLIECALGLYELALLHLIAHSCYKAHAFLSSGDAVNGFLRQQYVRASAPKAKHWFAALTCILIAAILAVSIVGAPPLFSPWVLIAIALVTLLAYHFNSPRKHVVIAPAIISVIGISVYVVFSFITAKLTPIVTEHYSLMADIWVCALFISLFCLFLRLQYASNNATTRNWFISLNAGFYLDEWSTRITLRLWPVTLPTTSDKYLKKSAAKTLSVKFVEERS
jgi:NAD(P)H-quinone oxidoreductase subunit 5